MGLTEVFLKQPTRNKHNILWEFLRSYIRGIVRQTSDRPQRYGWLLPFQLKNLHRILITWHLPAHYLHRIIAQIGKLHIPCFYVGRLFDIRKFDINLLILGCFSVKSPGFTLTTYKTNDPFPPHGIRSFVVLWRSVVFGSGEQLFSGGMAPWDLTGGKGWRSVKWMVSSCKMAGIHSRRNKQKSLFFFAMMCFTKSGSCFSLNHDCAIYWIYWQLSSWSLWLIHYPLVVLVCRSVATLVS